MKKNILLSILLLFLSCKLIVAHGIHIEKEINYPFVILTASFSQRSLLVDASVEVLAPETSPPFQKGRTDKKGKFAFLPNVAGEWKVTIDDERGHRKTETVEITESFFTEQPALTEIDKDAENDTLCAHAESYHHNHSHTHDGHVPQIYKIILGLALIFGITGIFYGLKSRKS